jgi:glutamine amidotransferase
MGINRVTVVDYGMGNLWSVSSALAFLDCQAKVTADPVEVSNADVLILPGVGSFSRAAGRLRETGLDEAILHAVRSRGIDLLGICLGMQLLGSRGTEDGDSAGLGLIPNSVERFTPTELDGRKIPHIGFNSVHKGTTARLFNGLPEEADFYFVHSFRMLPEGLPTGIATCRHGVEFVAAFEHENIFGVQFHPEKSQTNGLVLLKNFLH